MNEDSLLEAQWHILFCQLSEDGVDVDLVWSA
jgi:hypothetical protein